MTGRGFLKAVVNAVAAGRWVTFGAVSVLLFLVSAAWAISAPLGAGPDEPAHIIKAASVARGQFIGDVTDQPAVTSVQVPTGLADASAWPCYAFNGQQDASCVPPVSDEAALVPATTSAGLYNPVYYAMVGVPALLTQDTSLSVIVMRLAGALVVSVLLGATFCALVRLGDPLVTGVGFFAAVTPMVFFLAGVVNPNAMEIAAGLALLTSLLVVISGRTGRPTAWLVTAAASGVLLAQARGLSPLWMALIAVVLLVMTPAGRLRELLKRRSVWVTLAILAAGAAAGALWTLRTGTLGSLGTFPGAGEVTPVRAFFTMLVDRSFDPGIVGVFGWLDTPSPGYAYVLWSCLGLGTVVIGFVLGRGRPVWGLAVAVAGFVFVPPVVQGLSVTSSGYIWQGRYGLIAYAVMVVVAAVAVAFAGRGERMLDSAARRRTLWLLGVLIVTGQVFSLATEIKRFSVGLDGDWLDIVRNPMWSPPAGPLVWLLLGALAFSGIVAIWAATAARRIAADVPATSGTARTSAATG